MHTLYIRDLTIPPDAAQQQQQGTIINRRSKETINGILNGIIPRPPMYINNTPLGFIVAHSSEDDINLYFRSDNAEKLKKENITAKLSFKAQQQRELFIHNPDQDVYDKELHQLALEIETENHINIMQVDKFQSRRTNKKYITITMHNEAAKSNLASKGKIQLFGREFPVTCKHLNNTPAANQNPALAQQLRPGFFYTASAQAEGNMLSKSSNWGTKIPYNQYQTNKNQGLLPPPPALELTQLQENANTINSYMSAIANICEKLQTGLERPEFFVSSYNDILINNGLNAITVPHEIMNTSRKIFKTKSINRETERFLGDFGFHNQQILQNGQSSPPPSTPTRTTETTPPTSQPSTSRPNTPSPTSSPQTNNLTLNSPQLLPLDDFSAHYTASPNTPFRPIRSPAPLDHTEALSQPLPAHQPHNPNQHLFSCSQPSLSHSTSTSQQNES